VAQEQKVALIPFLLAGVGGVPELNQPDQIHPTAKGHALVASNVWLTLEPVLKTVAGEAEAEVRK
jgi:acyl-CoA thioesterase-1